MPLSFARPSDRSRFSTGALLKGLTWLFCIGLIVIGWAAVLQQVRFERAQAVAEAIAQNGNRAIAFEQYVRRTLEVATIATRYVAERFRRGDAGEEFIGTPARPAVLRGNLARTGTFLGIAVVNASGDLVATSRPGARPLNVADNEAFRVHVSSNDNDRLYVGRSFRAPAFGRDVILLTRRLDNADGSFGGIVSLVILPEQFTAFFRDARVGQDDVISLIGLDGFTRARRTGNVFSSGEDLRGGLVMQMQMQNPNGSYVGPSVLDGRVRIFSHRRLPEYGLFATYGVPEDEIMAAPRARAQVLIAAVALGTLATLGFALVVTLLINRGERHGQEALAEKAQLQEAQRLARMGDWQFDPERRETRWSAEMYPLFERDPALGPPKLEEYRSWLTEESAAVTRRVLKEVMEEGATREYEISLKLPSGTEAHHQVVAIPVHDKQGRIIGMRGTTQDIAGRKLIEQLQTRVAHLSRIDAMNAMATTLAHELNQPLTAAANYLAGSRRVLASAGDFPDWAKDGLVAAEQQVHFAAGIIRRLREMVANQPRTLTSSTAESVIDDALALVETGVGAPRPPVEKQLDPATPSIQADSIQVQQVLINLLRNAIEATRGRGDAEVAVFAQPWQADMVRLSVADNGPGFRQPESQRFSPFVADGEGMGLGLSISRTIVEAHGGRIWTENRSGGGAVVHFTLPAAAAKQEEPDAAVADRPRP